MSKSYSATKRNIFEYFDEHPGSSMSDVGYALSRHPNAIKRNKREFCRTHGSPKHCLRSVYKKDKQRSRQLDRNNRKIETYNIIKEYEET